MTKPHIHLAQFLCHGPTYHSLAMWRHPRTAAAGYEWARPELYQHVARVCERGKFDIGRAPRFLQVLRPDEDLPRPGALTGTDDPVLVVACF